ncbi:voltage-gated potassium channel [Variovorax humicola]|uniref:Voltage-gated potassium channel n=1 Tax=Variovorax humicola TaxID=1769758 RepID=A0ABU8WBF9_9BURK
MFSSLVVLVGIAPFLTETVQGRLLLPLGHVLVLLAAVAAVGRTVVPFVIASLLGLPALAFQVMAVLGGDDPAHAFVLSSSFFLAFYLAALVYLLRYVFSPDVMTDDKLFGAAAAYLMLGIAWAVAYGLVQRLDPTAFGVKPGEALRSFHDLLFMSVGYLTSNGPGDIVVTGPKARTLATLEQLAGTLFVAILIARLAGIYPSRGRVGRE